MVTTTRETERKFDAAEHDLLPIFSGMSEVGDQTGPEEQALEAVYYDTRDLRLARAGITLRRRSGGGDAGWHLKLPGGADSRDELRLPLGRTETDNAPPAELAALTRAHARGTELRPIAQVLTRRRRWTLADGAGEPVVEVVDDHVAAHTLGTQTTAKTWREVEIELIDQNKLKLLDRVERQLDKAGIRRSDAASKLARLLGDRLPVQPPTPTADAQSRAGRAVLAYIGHQAEEIIRYDPLVRQEVPDAVHRMRVATRRIRSTLQVFGKVIERERASQLITELKWLADVLGPARDLEVLRERFDEATAAQPAEDVVGPVQQRFTRYFARREADAADDVRAALDDPRYFALLDNLDTLLSDPPLTNKGRRRARRELPRLISRIDAKVTRRMRHADQQRPGSSRDTTLHDVRKAAKRLRYANEVARPVLGKPANRLRKRVKAVQQLLGEHHDAVVSRPVLREIAMQAHLDGENGYTFGVLHGQQGTVLQRIEDALPAAWRRLTARKQHRWLR
ncbi:MAG: CYTH and CHAD domain-containing protein [Pseudonocardiales bacterium]